VMGSQRENRANADTKGAEGSVEHAGASAAERLIVADGVGFAIREEHRAESEDIDVEPLRIGCLRQRRVRARYLREGARIEVRFGDVDRGHRSWNCDRRGAAREQERERSGLPAFQMAPPPAASRQSLDVSARCLRVHIVWIPGRHALDPRASVEGDPVTENRRHPRTRIASPVVFQVAEGPRIDAVFTDVSLGGMYIETATPLPYGTAVRVSLRLPGMKQETRIEAIVRWAEPSGMGVQFGVMGARETYALTALLAAG
jgi:hypothetical protein